MTHSNLRQFYFLLFLSFAFSHTVLAGIPDGYYTQADGKKKAALKAAMHDIIQPTIGVMTSLGAAHQKSFRSMEEKCMEKLLLMQDAKVIVYNADDDLVSRCIRRSGL